MILIPQCQFQHYGFPRSTPYTPFPSIVWRMQYSISTLKQLLPKSPSFQSSLWTGKLWKRHWLERERYHLAHFRKLRWSTIRHFHLEVYKPQCHSLATKLKLCQGLSGLKGFNITDIRLNLNAQNGEPNMSGLAVIPNPSVLTVELVGNCFFPFFLFFFFFFFVVGYFPGFWRRSWHNHMCHLPMFLSCQIVSRLKSEFREMSHLPYLPQELVKWGTVSLKMWNSLPALTNLWWRAISTKQKLRKAWISHQALSNF